MLTQKPLCSAFLIVKDIIHSRLLSTCHVSGPQDVVVREKQGIIPAFMELIV